MDVVLVMYGRFTLHVDGQKWVTSQNDPCQEWFCQQVSILLAKKHKAVRLLHGVGPGTAGVIVVRHCKQVASGNNDKPILFQLVTSDTLLDSMESTVGTRIFGTTAFSGLVINQQESTLGLEGCANRLEELGAVHRHVVEVVKGVLHRDQVILVDFAETGILHGRPVERPTMLAQQERSQQATAEAA